MYLCYLLYKDLKVGKRQENLSIIFSENSDFKESEIKTEGHSDLNEQKSNHSTENSILEYFRVRRASVTVLLVALFFGLGVYIGFNQRPEINKVVNILGKETAVATEADFSPFWKVWNSINEKYPNASKTSDQNKIYGAIFGLVGSLNDPYSVFFNPDDAKLFEDNIQEILAELGWKSA